MRLRVRLDPQTLRRWHLRLLERLAARPGLALSIARCDGGASLADIERQIYREARLRGVARPSLFDRVAPESLDDFGPGFADPPDQTLILSGATDEPGWVLSFDGVQGERGLFEALTAARAPVLTLGSGEDVLAVGRLGTETPGNLVGAFEDTLARTITLILAALDGGASPTLPPLADVPEPAGIRQAPPRPLSQAGRILARRAARMAYGLISFSPHWRIGWRHVEGPDLVDLRRHPEQGWHSLPDDGWRFYADPFPIEHAGGTTLFVEAFDHRTRKGVIAAVPFTAEGPVGIPKTVLERSYHLSYPFVFEADGAIWMVPESCAANRIDLFRATDFPRGWAHEATLVEDVAASDATVLRHEGRWWMFATVRDDDGGSYSDALHLWSADDIRGPWRPHRRNPVLIDIASARPAGRIVSRNGALIRPVQDCRKGYGRALSLARITRLDDDGFEQVVETTLTAGAAWPGSRIHSLNAAGGFEFIDGSKRIRRRWF